MYDTGSLFTDLFTGKNKFEHTCKKCNMKVSLDKMYPDEEVIEIEVVNTPN